MFPYDKMFHIQIRISRKKMRLFRENITFGAHAKHPRRSRSPSCMRQHIRVLNYANKPVHTLVHRLTICLSSRPSRSGPRRLQSATKSPSVSSDSRQALSSKYSSLRLLLKSLTTPYILQQ